MATRRFSELTDPIKADPQRAANIERHYRHAQAEHGLAPLPIEDDDADQD